MNLSFYTKKDWLPQERKHLPMLFPFWGIIQEPIGSPDAGRFEELANKGKEFLTMVEDPADAEVFVLPFEYVFNEYQDLYREIEDFSCTYAKPVMIFFNNDSDQPIAFKNAIIFRTSLYKSKRSAWEFALPGWSKDFLKNGQLCLRAKTNNPSVGYCGYVDYFSFVDLIKKVGWQSALKMYLKKKNFFTEGEQIRGYAVRSLQKDIKINTEFIIRKGFWAYEVEDKLKAREDYLNNMIGSDYVITARGGGNFSYRFYEVLSCGRIPIFINTDCVLPYEEYIGFEHKIVWVEKTQLKNIANFLKAFHEKLTPAEFINRQIELREIYEQWMSPVGFHKNLWRIVRKKRDAAITVHTNKIFSGKVS